jgi:orotate phosphoribosyltransferase
MMSRIKLALAIAQASKLRGEFRLRSGAVTTEYFDKYRFEADPVLLGAIADSLVTLVPSATDALAGLELGGVPLATALSLRTGLPAIFVRKRAKEYGTCRLAEGGDIAGRRLLVVEDVVTSGGQVLASCEELRRLGATVDHAICVIDRQAGGAEALRTVGVELRALLLKSDLERAEAAGAV